MVAVTSYWFLLLTLLSALFSNGESLSFFLSFFCCYYFFFIFPIFVSEAGIHPAGTISIHLVKMVSINQMPVHQECELQKS